MLTNSLRYMMCTVLTKTSAWHVFSALLLLIIVSIRPAVTLGTVNTQLVRQLFQTRFCSCLVPRVLVGV